MKRSRTMIMMLAAGAGPLFACATTTPPELIEARAAYRRAASGPAVEYARPQLSTAKRALDRAEKEFKDDGNDLDTRDFAYVAERLAEQAEAQAHLQVAQDTRAETERKLELARAEQQHNTQVALGEAQKEISQLSTEKEQERIARIEAERKQREAMETLAKIGEVKEEARGYVVNVTGSVLFATGKSTLLPSAENRLMALVDALNSMPSNQRVVIEGHTDSTGSDSLNQRLSEARAAAVRSFLVRHGVTKERLEAIGMGESDPVAENTTPEGRANNRRVEIVIEKAT